MTKIEQDGCVAVLYSPGYGAGWSTWADEQFQEALCMDARIVGPFLAGNTDAAITAAKIIAPNVYTGGAHQLEVIWIKKGTAFQITEYDGSESVEELNNQVFLVA